MYNSSSIKLQQVVSDNTLPANMSGYIIDETWYVQQSHGPFGKGDSNGNKDTVNSGEATSVRYKEFDVFDIYNDINVIDVNGDVYGVSHKQRMEKEAMNRQIEKRIKYRGNDKEMYRGVKGVHF